MLHVNVANIVLGERDPPVALPEINLSLPDRTIRVRELIALTVECQIELLRARRSHSERETRTLLERQYLGGRELEKQARRGKIAMPGPEAARDERLDVGVEARRAVNAFAAGRFKVFVAGRELVDPDERVSMEDGQDVRFVRLVPLVGG